MKLLSSSLSAFLVVFLPLAASAQTVHVATQFAFDDIDLSRYSDSPWDQRTNVAVSALTRMGVTKGNDDGTFAPNRHLNRAEFITIVMRLLDDHQSISLNCFPDVSSNAWYAEDVCRAKSLGLVRGNAVVGQNSSLWRFEASRDIQYEEAVKVLAEVYSLHLSGNTEGMDWYVPYIRAAVDADININGLFAGSLINRSQMARLTIAFVANDQNRLSALRDAEDASSSSRSSSSRSSSRSSRASSMSSSSSSSRASSTSSIVGEAIRSHIVVLGTLTPALASVNFFSDSEPVDINAVIVTFAAPVPSIGSLIIYDKSGAQIGIATAVSGSSSQFRGSIAYGKLLLPYREERGLFVKARLKSKDTGGVSGEDIQVQSITVEGDGRWTNEMYTRASNDTFTVSETAFGKITSITNAGTTEGTIVSGLERHLADLVVNADTPEAQNQVRLTSLVFTIEQAGGVTISNVTLRNEDNSMSSLCTVSSLLVTCAAIDSGIGTIDMSRRIKLVGDVSVPNNATNPSLRLVLNDPGTSATIGAITWTDGSASLTWVDLEQPVVGGTRWR